MSSCKNRFGTFSLRIVHVGFVVDRVAMGEVWQQAPRLPHPISIPSMLHARRRGVLDDAAVPKDLDPPNFKNRKTLLVESERNSYRNCKLHINLYSPYFCRK